jgi:hypothetical protein
MKLYHCFRDEPKQPWEVTLPTMTVTQAHPSERERLEEYLSEQAEYGMTPDVYYCSEKPLFGYGPFVQVITISDEYVFKATAPGEFIMPSDQIENSEIFFNPNTDHQVENSGYPLWK